jgi:phage-related tail fiber protein
MRPITPRMRAELGAPDNPHRALIEAQAEVHSSSKKTKTDFQTADTFTARTADFTASNALTAAGQTVEAVLANAPAANALYEAHYSVSIKTTVPSSNSNTLKITIAVETDPTGVGSWTEQWARDYDATRKVGEAAAPEVHEHERLPVRVTGFNSSGKLRLKIKSASGPGSFSVHGFNLATNADPTNGVTYHTGPAMDFLDSGQGVTLADTVVSKISHGSSDGYEQDLGGPPFATDQAPFITARIVWGKDDQRHRD